MRLEFDLCYQALLAHDARFDGIFFVAVRSTGIYCRPICPTKVPMAKNCTFFSTAAAAEQAGYRPCLRCRPELAPGNAKIDSVSRLASLIAQHIEDGALTNSPVSALAQKIGISERHLRRVVESEFGVSPLDLAQTSRLLAAKRLLTDTNFPITEVAFISGFSSVRRFNTVFRQRYNLTPSQLRKRRLTSNPTDSVTYTLGYRPPFDGLSLLQFFSLRTAGGAEVIQDNTYIRTVETIDGIGWIEVRLHQSQQSGRLKESHSSKENGKPQEGGRSRKGKSQENSVTVRMSISLARSMTQILRKVRHLFDLDANPLVIAEHRGALAQGKPGLRLPGAFHNFELSTVSGGSGLKQSLFQPTKQFLSVPRSSQSTIHLNLQWLIMGS